MKRQRRSDRGGSKVGKKGQSLALLLVCITTQLAAAGPAVADFGIKPGSFVASGTDNGGSPLTQAGDHPNATTGFMLNEISDGLGNFLPDEDIRDVKVDLPTGLVGNATGIPRCPQEDFNGDGLARCPTESQIGVVTVTATAIAGAGIDPPYVLPVYNLEPPADEPVLFGFRLAQSNVTITADVRTGSDYGITATIKDLPGGIYVHGSALTLWGVPADSAHDAQRFLPASQTGLPGDENGDPLPSGVQPRALMINPTRCTGEPVLTTISARSWQDTDRWVTDVAASPGVTGCDRLRFEPSLALAPRVTRAASPSGYDVELSFAQPEGPLGLASAALKDAEVTLPAGVVVNPSSADGLGACSVEQIGLGDAGLPACPATSKIGTVEIETPLLARNLTGSIYLARQTSERLLRIYLTAIGSGVVVKLAGDVDPDPVTGQLTARFLDNPQLPVERVSLSFKEGPRAALSNPRSCGSATTNALLTPWSGTASVSVVAAFDIDRGADGGACREPIFAPRFAAGTANPVAGGSSPFALTVSRDDGDSHLATVDRVQLPDGLLGRVGSVPLCGEADAAAGACPQESRIGHVQVAAGAGPAPVWVPQQGRRPTGVYLTGPYRGAPYGLSVVVPAQAGPFDLGTVVARSALHLDRRTARISTAIDETRVYDTDGTLVRMLDGALPDVLKGIPLNLRELRVLVDRPDFIVNPTDCDEASISARLTSTDGVAVDRSTRFQVGDCQALPFKPRLSLALSGRRQRTTGRHPGVRAVVRQSGLGEAAIDRAVVRLPKSLALDPENAQALCEFDAGTKPDLENHCPKGSVVGRARASSPLLRRDLVGNVYFVKNIRRDPRTGATRRTLPMIVVALRGEIAINLRGESSTTKRGRLVNTFAMVPDAPISRFNLNIRGGRDGILAVTRTRRSRIDLCDDPRGHTADTAMRGQNGKRRDFRVTVKTPCTAPVVPRRR